MIEHFLSMNARICAICRLVSLFEVGKLEIADLARRLVDVNQALELIGQRDAPGIALIGF